MRKKQHSELLMIQTQEVSAILVLAHYALVSRICAGRKVHYQSKDLLILPLPQAIDRVTLPELIQTASSASQNQDGEDCAVCSNNEAPHFQTRQLSRFPETLRMAVKRFHSHTGVKLQTSVHLPSLVTLSGTTPSLVHENGIQSVQVVPTTCEYVIQAVGCHIGSPRNAGHCVSYIRNTHG